MGLIMVLAGDFAAGRSYFDKSSAEFRLFKKTKYSWAHKTKEKISLFAIDEIEVANEENVKNVQGALGLGAAGGLLLGPAGLLGGILISGNKKEVTFVVKFIDGRKFMATTDNSTFKEIQTALFDLSIT